MVHSFSWDNVAPSFQFCFCFCPHIFFFFRSIKTKKGLKLVPLKNDADFFFLNPDINEWMSLLLDFRNVICKNDEGVNKVMETKTLSYLVFGSQILSPFLLLNASKIGSKSHRHNHLFFFTRIICLVVIYFFLYSFFTSSQTSVNTSYISPQYIFFFLDQSFCSFKHQQLMADSG